MRDWDYGKTKEERMKSSPWMYPNADANIFNDEPYYDDARSEETDSEDAADESEYGPAEDGHEQGDEDSEEEITWAGDHEEVPAQNFDVVVPEQIFMDPLQCYSGLSRAGFVHQCITASTVSFHGSMSCLGSGWLSIPKRWLGWLDSSSGSQELIKS